MKITLLVAALSLSVSCLIAPSRAADSSVTSIGRSCSTGSTSRSGSTTFSASTTSSASTTRITDEAATRKPTSTTAGSASLAAPLKPAIVTPEVSAPIQTMNVADQPTDQTAKKHLRIGLPGLFHVNF